MVRFEPFGGRETCVRLHHTGWGDGGEWDRAYAYFDRAWGSVLANLRKRFDSGPLDWREWLARLRQLREQAQPGKSPPAPPYRLPRSCHVEPCRSDPT